MLVSASSPSDDDVSVSIGSSVRPSGAPLRVKTGAALGLAVVEDRVEGFEPRRATRGRRFGRSVPMSRRKRLSGGPAPAPATSGGGSRTFVETTGRRRANSALGGQAVQCSPSAWFLERLPSVWSAGSSRERRPRAALAGLDATVLGHAFQRKSYRDLASVLIGR